MDGEHMIFPSIPLFLFIPSFLPDAFDEPTRFP